MAYPALQYNGFPGILGNLGPSALDVDPVPAARPPRAPGDRPRAKDCRWLAPMHEQTSLGACVPHAGLWLAECDVLKRTGRKIDFARRPAYFWGREKIGTTQIDSGMFARDCVIVMRDIGCAGEPLDPYDIARFKERPNSVVVAEAFKHRIEGFLRLQGLEQILDSIDDDSPVMTAHVVPTNWRGREWPANPGPSAGRHQTAFFGYDFDHVCPGYPPGALKRANWWHMFHEGQRWSWFPMSLVGTEDNVSCYDNYAIGRVGGFAP